MQSQQPIWNSFPDLFAFTPVMLWMIYGIMSGALNPSHLPRPSEFEPAAADTLPIFRITRVLYDVSHSAVIFAIIFTLAWVLRNVFVRSGQISGKPSSELSGGALPNLLNKPRDLLLGKRGAVWELGGWLLHILIDIPTHSYKFYPTPFLWPIAGTKFDGLPWDTIWFQLINYSTLLIVFILLSRRKKGS